MSRKKPSAKPVRTDGLGLAQRVLRSAQHQEMVRAGERVGVAVSGGADSVALLLLLLELREKLGIVLSVAHFNHKLRGTASDGDEKFVVKLAEKLGLALHVAREDVAAKAKREKANLEEAGRKARYAYFERLIQEGYAAKIAVAHTADDQAETVLAHILRGTGLAGLGGIHPQAGGVMRPLLKIRRSELRAYLKAHKQSWREDRSNQDTTRLRARIRKKLLPLIEKEFPSRAVEHLGTLADIAREDEAFLEFMAKLRASEQAVRAENTVRINISDLLGQGERPMESRRNFPRRFSSVAIAKRIIQRVAEEVKPRPGQLNAEHVNAILELAARGENGKLLEMPGGVTVQREEDRLVFSARERDGAGKFSKSRGAIQFSHSIVLEKGETKVYVPELECAFRFRAIDWVMERRDTNWKDAVLDRERLQQPLVLRNWRPGDRMHALGHQKPRKLTRFFNENRISRWTRQGWPVLTSKGTVAWVRGLPAAAEFAATETTRTGILIVEEAN